MIRAYEFAERLAFSQGQMTECIERILRDRIPGCIGVRKAERRDDKNGTDYWADRDGLPPLSIDVKVRSEDWAKRGKDDLALETWSVMRTKVGWTRDDKKRTDYVLWVWKDTGRFFLVSFPALCKVFQRYWIQWKCDYDTAIQSSGNWRSECVYVPRSVIVEKLMAWMQGELPKNEVGLYGT